MHRAVLLPLLALVTLAPCAAGEEPLAKGSALKVGQSVGPVPVEPSGVAWRIVDDQPDVEPASYADSAPAEPIASAEQAAAAAPMASTEPVDSGELVDPGEPLPEGVEDYEFFDAPGAMSGGFPDPYAPAPAVSSGNWLRSCCWYTEQSAVYYTRTANVKNDVRLAAEFIPPFANLFSNTLDVALDPGYEPGLRSTFGRYLGRDARNRTHAVEFTFIGLTHWGIGQSLTAQTPGTIDQLIDPLTVVPVYNVSDVQAFEQTSDFNSYEINYRIERRLGRDRLVYSRDSHWVREATPSLLCSVLAGVRVSVINENIDWTASNTLGNGRYVVDTHNYMVGPQGGIDLFYERAYWRAGVRTQAGALVNWASQSSTVRILDPDGVPLVANRDEHAEDHMLSFVGGVSFIGQYRFRPNFGLRLSYDMIWATDLALAQNQLTFFPSVPAEISASHSLFFHGATLGLEWCR